MVDSHDSPNFPCQPSRNCLCPFLHNLRGFPELSKSLNTVEQYHHDDTAVVAMHNNIILNIWTIYSQDYTKLKYMAI